MNPAAALVAFLLGRGSRPRERIIFTEGPTKLVHVPVTRTVMVPVQMPPTNGGDDEAYVFEHTPPDFNVAVAVVEVSVRPAPVNANVVPMGMFFDQASMVGVLYPDRFDMSVSTNPLAIGSLIQSYRFVIVSNIDGSFIAMSQIYNSTAEVPGA